MQNGICNPSSYLTERRSQKGPSFFEVPLRLSFPARIVFSSRRGGVSQTPYDSLNLGFGVGDDPQMVAENRQLLAQAAAAPSRIRGVRQRHTGKVMWADPLKEREDCECDGLLTDTPGLALLICVADCIPVALTSTEPALVCVVHAGRKGIEAGIMEAAVEKIIGAGSDPESIKAFLGPGIGPCCYEVSPSMCRVWAEKFPGTTEGNRLNLPASIANVLAEAGIAAQHIWRNTLCTLCHPQLFFSYRRSPDTGRQGVLAWL